ncbi:MAG: ABC transporter substrate-binding protein [Gemmiger sp.]
MKKVFALLLAAMMVVAMFAGCGSSKDPASDTNAAPATESAAAPAEGTEAPAGDSDAAAPIKIGMTGPLTGGAAVYGTAVKAGMEIAVEEINAMGGLQIEFRGEDDEHDAEKAVSAYNQLKDWGMQILAGTVTTGPSLAVGPETVSDNIFMLTPSASAEDVALIGDNVFQICFTDPNQGAGSAQLMASRNMAENIAVIYDSSDAYSTGIYESFKAEAETQGLNIVCVTTFTADNKSDLSTQVTQCQEAGADLVFLPFYATEAAQVLTYANKIGYAPVFFGCDGMDGILTVEGFDTTLAEGLVMMTPFAADAEDDATQSFVAKYKEKMGGETPNQFAADGYDVIYSLYQACVAAGVDGNTPADEVCAKLIAQFTTMSFDGLTGSGMTWSENGMVSKVPTAVVVKDGAYVGM